MGEVRHGHELGETRVLVVPAAWRVVMAGQTVEEPTRHGDLDPHLGGGPAGGRGPAGRRANDIGGNGRGCHSFSLH